MKYRNFPKGFTLLELMVVVVIIAVFAAIAFPSYQLYVRRAMAAQAQDRVQYIASELERYKSRNFNYMNFTIPLDQRTIPSGATGSDIKYSISMLADANGQNWILKAESKDNRNDSFLMTSLGQRCKTKHWSNINSIAITGIANAHCGGGESW
ncbi:type IV pilin protein [Acinetobacter pseudolwoffii]|uniref:type IV pilin protein n=1 Tax=Acinetobacter pseudolwoffii TaxID=2053287 RepID=UPI0039890108